jgi:hypothetical protein
MYLAVVPGCSVLPSCLVVFGLPGGFWSAWSSLVGLAVFGLRRRFDLRRGSWLAPSF